MSGAIFKTEFRLDGEFPTVTAQMRGVRIVTQRGKPIPVFYKTKRVEAAEDYFMFNIPASETKPMEGAIELRVCFTFPWRKSEKKRVISTFQSIWKPTAPDTDNLLKLFKDCIGKRGHWIDDAQVAREVVEKHWGDNPGITVSIAGLDAGTLRTAEPRNKTN